MVSHLVKPKKKNKLGQFIEMLFQKIRDTSAKDYPEVLLYVYLTYASVVRFNSISMAWYGPLALKLINSPVGEAGSITVGVMGTTVKLPNAQQAGLAMLAVLGVLSILDGIPTGWFTGDSSPFDPQAILKEKARVAGEEYIPPGATEPFATFEEFIEFGRVGIG